MPDEILIHIFKELSARDLRRVSLVSQRARRVAKTVFRRPSFDRLPCNLLIKIFEHLPLNSLMALSKCNSTVRHAALHASLWNKVVIFEPYVCPYEEDIQKWVKEMTGVNPLVSFFDTIDLSKQIARFKTWKIYPSTFA